MPKPSQLAPKKTVGRKLPRLLTLVACDGVTRDPNTGKATLYGVFDQINAWEFPASSAFAVYAKMAGGFGSWAMSFDVIDPRGKSVIAAPPVMEIDFELEQKREFVVIGLPLQLKRAGLHRLRIKAGGREIGWAYELSVVLHTKEKP